MFLRLLFVLLCALNIAVGAWLWLEQPYARGGNPTDPGVPEMHLLSELPSTAISTLPVAAAPPVAQPIPASTTPGSNTCLALGPFDTPLDLRHAKQTVATQAIRMRSRQEQTTQASGWWVYLPAAASRAQALEQARQLGAKQISDYFVISAGDHSNTISLGLFKDPANARKRRDEVAAAGFPARMSERDENVPEYWLDLVLPDSNSAIWRERIKALGAGSHSTGCF
jgi:hypothetical protein